MRAILSPVSSFRGADPRSPSDPVRSPGAFGERLPAMPVRQRRGPCRWPAGSTPQPLFVRHRHRRRTIPGGVQGVSAHSLAGGGGGQRPSARGERSEGLAP